MHFLMKTFDSEIKFPIDNTLALVADTDLTTNRRENIIWTNDGPCYWCIYTSLGLNELTHSEYHIYMLQTEHITVLEDVNKKFPWSSCHALKMIFLDRFHYDDVIMSAMVSQITSLTIVYSNVSGADQRKHQSSASLAFVWGIHRGPVNSPHKWPVTRKMLPFDDVIMYKQNLDVKAWIRNHIWWFSLRCDYSSIASVLTSIAI